MFARFARLFTLPRENDVEKGISERTALLADNPLPSYSQPKEPSLIEKIEHSLTILKNTQAKLALQNKPLRTKHARYVYACTILLLFCFVLAGGSIAQIFIVMEILYKQALPELKKQLKELKAQLLETQAKEKLAQEAEDEAYAAYNNITKALQPEKDALNEVGWINLKAWDDKSRVNNCQEWFDDSGKQHSLAKDFPEAVEAWWQNYFCWFEDNNQTHPITECNNMQRTLCAIEQRFIEINTNITQYEGIAYDKSDARYHLQNRIHWLEADIRENEYAQNHPEPDLASIMIGIPAAGVILTLIVFMCVGVTSKQTKYIEEKNRSQLLKNCPMDSNEMQYIKKISARLKIDKVEDMQLPALIKRLTKELKAARKRHPQRMAFLSGSLAEKNFQASNRNFLSRDTGGDLTRMIFERADLLPKPK